MPFDCSSSCSLLFYILYLIVRDANYLIFILKIINENIRNDIENIWMFYKTVNIAAADYPSVPNLAIVLLPYLKVGNN